jgi:hypothetical protein
MPTTGDETLVPVQGVARREAYCTPEALAWSIGGGICCGILLVLAISAGIASSCYEVAHPLCNGQTCRLGKRDAIEPDYCTVSYTLVKWTLIGCIGIVTLIGLVGTIGGGMTAGCDPRRCGCCPSRP